MGGRDRGQMGKYAPVAQGPTPGAHKAQGETRFEVIPSFDHPLPLACRCHRVDGRTVPHFFPPPLAAFRRRTLKYFASTSSSSPKSWAEAQNQSHECGLFPIPFLRGTRTPFFCAQE